MIMFFKLNIRRYTGIISLYCVYSLQCKSLLKLTLNVTDKKLLPDCIVSK